jgi:hypothetical protein
MLSNKLFLFTAFLLLCLFVFISSKGLGSTVDAEAYVFAAQSLKKEFVLLTSYGYYTNWAPLFPCLLAILGTYITQFLALVLNIALLYWVGGLVLPKRSIYHYLFFLHSSFSVTFLMIHFFVWSEAWFLVFLLGLFVCFAKSFIQKRLSTKIFLLMIVLANLLCLQRLAGVFLVVGFAVLIYWHFSFRRAFTFSLFSATGLGIWQLRNSFIQEKPDFLENIFMVRWQESYWDYAKTIFNFFLPSYWLSMFFAIFLLFLLLLFLVVLVFQKNLVASLSAICFCYLAAMLVLRMNVAGESERYLAPIQPFLLLIFWHLAEKLGKIIQWKSILYGILLITLTFQMLRTAKNLKQWKQTPPKLIVKQALLKKLAHRIYLI